MRLTKQFLAAAISAALLIGAPVASAQTSAQQGYSTPGGDVETRIENGGGNNPGNVVSTPESVTPTKKAGKLPFTGLDLVLVVGAGGLLVALGFGMRRLARPTGLA